MKKLIALIKSLFTKKAEAVKAYAEVKKEAEVHAEQIVKALDEVKKSKIRPSDAPVAPIAATELTKAPAKKKKKYYKPKPKQA